MYTIEQSEVSELFRPKIGGGLSPDKSRHLTIEIHSANKSDYHALGQSGRFKKTGITSLKARP